MADEPTRPKPGLMRWLGRGLLVGLGAAGAGVAWKKTETIRKGRADDGRPAKRRLWRKKMKSVLLVTHHPLDVEALAKRIDEPDVAFFAATNEPGVRAFLRAEKIDFVCMGGGLSDEERGHLCAVVMSIRDDIHIHLKDRASGPAGMATFVKALINGFR